MKGVSWRRYAKDDFRSGQRGWVQTGPKSTLFIVLPDFPKGLSTRRVVRPAAHRAIVGEGPID
ncbi:MAG: hypothetical protein OXN89_26860 [Bryobacterales bacterium]|nr:hypothetical protein [Bryobacterales bacterium]